MYFCIVNHGGGHQWGLRPRYVIDRFGKSGRSFWDGSLFLCFTPKNFTTMFKEQINPNEYQYKIEYYGLNALPVVSASVHVWKWRKGWEPSYKFTKAITTSRSGAHYVHIIICTDDYGTAHIFYRLIHEFAVRRNDVCQVYFLKKDKVFERVKEFYVTAKKEAE